MSWAGLASLLWCRRSGQCSSVDAEGGDKDVSALGRMEEDEVGGQLGAGIRGCHPDCKGLCYSHCTPMFLLRMYVHVVSH